MPLTKVTGLDDPPLTTTSTDRNDHVPNGPAQTNPRKQRNQPRQNRKAAIPKKRSRKGCFSCKKLKIKCDEARPSCEYCMHTDRICVYPSDTQTGSSATSSGSGISPVEFEPDADSSRADASRASSKASSISTQSVSDEEYFGLKMVNDLMVVNDLTNGYVKSLNSMQSAMKITRFEQKLLKLYLDFGGAFFTGNKHAESQKVFEVDAPQLWSRSPLMKNAIYAISTMYLWRFYRLNHISNVYLSGDGYLIIYTNSDPNDLSLFQITDSYIQETFRLLRDSLLHVNIYDNPDDVGVIILANIILFSVISVHPVSEQILSVFNGSSNYLADLIEVSSGIINVADTRSDLISGTSYETVLYRHELLISPPENEPTMFPFIQHLQDYLRDTIQALDPLYAVYHLAVSQFESACFLAVRFGYVLPILRTLMALSRNVSFVALLRVKDYIAMKIMYYLCCVISICGIKMFMEASLWDSYIEEFYQLAYDKFGGFEDQFDLVMYRHVHDRIADAYKRKGKPFLDTEQLKLIGSGKPLDSKMAIGQTIRY
ncbi:Lysine biosynthesis regulatory protein LYS14 [Cyberlindnera fabianii]|uniref:Lysine biosynthesis regulatory protein LYS14 n=1 Tax=Cyberlindnera fabianii TaxID=36022 RepID=A0A1V2LCY6_CYBFA|nr:Lysine biosynthesis regulatory protein LYS14 [Cyberlindnera fabianii]